MKGRRMLCGRLRRAGSESTGSANTQLEGKAADPIHYIYSVGHSQGRLKSGTQWTRHVEFDESRLITRERLISHPARAPDWNVYEFEVKDHGYTLYYKHTSGRDVAVRERVLYFRPVPKKKKSDRDHSKSVP